MTYCVGLRLEDGLVMLADTRTNAGVDNIATFRKLHLWETPGERVICLMSAGNLAMSQAVVTLVGETGCALDDDDDTPYTIETVPTMFQAAQLVGCAIREGRRMQEGGPGAEDVDFGVTMLIGGQIGSRRMRLFQVYAAGNFIEATEDTPFLQIGEHKYGKPILDRAAAYDTPVENGVRLALISMDSTMRSNLSVGMPIDLMVYRRDALEVGLQRRIEENDPYFSRLRENWSDALNQAYRALPGPDWRY